VKPQLFDRWIIIAAIGAVLVPTSFAIRAAAQAEKLTWDRDVAVKRVAKAGRKAPRPRPRVERAPLLTLEYRVMQVRIRPNQNGYLYTIQSTDGRDGQIIFPDSRINDGRNLVAKNEGIFSGEARSRRLRLSLSVPFGIEF